MSLANEETVVQHDAATGQGATTRGVSRDVKHSLQEKQFVLASTAFLMCPCPREIIRIRFVTQQSHKHVCVYSVCVVYGLCVCVLYMACVCVCVCVCARARASVCVRDCVHDLP